MATEQKKRLWEKILEIIIFISLAGMVLFTFTNAFLRYAFNKGIPVGEELARFLFVWTVYMGAVLAYKEGKHVNVDILISKMRGRVRIAFLFISCLSILAACAVMIWGGWHYLALSSSTYGAASGISFAFISVSFFLAAVIMCIQTIFKFKESLERERGT